MAPFLLALEYQPIETTKAAEAAFIFNVSTWNH